MILKSAEFYISSKEIKKCPKPDKPEYAFIGRSNVGKSSLINLLTSKKGLAKTSATPGKTQLINHFIITSEPSVNTDNKQLPTINLEQWYLVDLPGLGYAKSSKSNREEWEKMIYNYLCNRTSLMNIFVLIDSRHTTLKNDHELINRLGEYQLPFTIVLTKTDKLKKSELEQNISELKSMLSLSWEEIPEILCTSSFNKTGSQQILDIIQNCNSIFKQ